MYFPTDLPDDERPVLVLGATSVDIVGRVDGELSERTSNPAAIRTSFGGTARNFAENLARLGQPVTLLSGIGQDQLGRQIIRYTESAEVDVSRIIESGEHATGTYLAVVDGKGELKFALDDMQVIQMLTPEYIEKQRDAFESAGMLFIDANLPEDTIEATMELAKELGLPVAADPTSSGLAAKLKPYLPQISLMIPNSREASVLCGFELKENDSQAGLQAAKQLVSEGVDIAVVTLAEFGVSYATSEISGHIPAIRTKIIDPTGAGDALSAAVAFALLNEISHDEAVRLGVAAASLTLRHRGAVRPDLSLELLYDQLT